MSRGIIIIGCGHLSDMHRALLREELRRVALSDLSRQDKAMVESVLEQVFTEPIRIVDFKCLEEPVQPQIPRRPDGRETWKFNKQRHNRGLK